MNPNTLGLDPDRMRFLNCSPAATRRISCGSLFKPNEPLDGSKSSLLSGLNAKDETPKEETSGSKEKGLKKLPIINPLVRSPHWPSEFSDFVMTSYHYSPTLPPTHPCSIMLIVSNMLRLHYIYSRTHLFNYLNYYFRLLVLLGYDYITLGIRAIQHIHTDITNGTGFISKCLMANADTLCAAVSPLMDPDETLNAGFHERCVMNNYFGIGIDAKISLDFHMKREEHPEKCRSRARNYMWYGVLGSKQLLQQTFKNLEQRVQLECDGQRIPLPSLQGIVILNIPSFMGGTNFWGGTKEDDCFLAPSFDDKVLEVVAVFGRYVKTEIIFLVFCNASN